MQVHGTIASFSGGDAGVAMLSGFIRSMVGTYGMDNNWGNVETIGSAMLMGGVSSELSGGEFWRGAAIGGIVAGANHVAHRVGASAEEKVREKRQQQHRRAQGIDIFQGTGRPDEDGYITFLEARDWYRNGGGKSLYADLAGLDLSKISASDFPEGIGSSKVFNLDQKYFANKNDAAVYGSISLRLTSQNTVVATSAFDIYDFDIKPWSSQTFIRNVATMGANAIHGSGQSFVIWIYGQGKIGK